ncbi:Crp/Fnr family transcriptional regulator [Candidatus Microgenomates bacterium]|nr:Crp/Fnr family transcriptional regulator [Candidatus Microgenomates bacterium]
MTSSPSEKLNEFFAQFPPLRYKKRETILRAGEVPQGLHFLESGYVRLHALSEDGEELTLVIYKPGDFFPVVWTFYGGGPSIYYFETLTPVLMRRASREPFLEFIQANPDVFMLVTQRVISRFQISLRRMEYLTFGNASARLASVLLVHAKEIGVERDGGIEFQIPLTHKDLANLVGMTRETMSIELKRFERAGLIGHIDHRLVIKDKEGLEKEAIL